MKKQIIETATERNYVSPLCEEIPVWAEGPLCDSGDQTESVEEYEGTI
jgi:hypothetical protein